MVEVLSIFIEFKEKPNIYSIYLHIDFCSSWLAQVVDCFLQEYIGLPTPPAICSSHKMCWKIGRSRRCCCCCCCKFEPMRHKRLLSLLAMLPCLVERVGSSKKKQGGKTGGKTKLIYTGNSLSAKTI